MSHSASAGAFTDVLVIGAGPTGLTLACDLARRGVDVRVIERFDRPSVASRGKGLQPRSLEILDDLGVAGEILARGATKLPVRMIDADGSVVDREPIATPVPDPSMTPYPELLWIAEFDVEGPLRDRLALDGVHVEFATTATALEQHDDHVLVHVNSARGPASIRARWVVGADGGKSTVRHCLGLPFEGFTMDDYWYLGDLRLDGLDHSLQYIFPTAEGMIGLTPLPTTDLWQWQSTIKAGAELREPSLPLYQRLLDEHLGAGRVTLTDATWLSLYRANVRLVPRYRVGRVLLAGDAAHAHSPAGAQGMNTGIQDSWNLAWKLGAVLSGADASLLDTYEEERRPVAAAVLRLSTTRMRKFVATAADGADGVNKGLASMGGEVTTGLAIGYPASSLSLDGRRAERAPYAAGLRGPGFAGSTFDLFRGPHWTILVFSDRADSTKSFAGLPADVHVHRIGTGAIHDSRGAAAARFDTGPETVVLVRPDGYIAARAPLGETAQVRAHVQRLTERQSVAA
ncbi:FAD-dependent oxidoreductase [Amycolatopsis australiensis]|uniref:2-polyprenyl-6-methoxyphenol hydroxylase n=1 Tax=Amycolatopsis australiensis TaxID=546364 RepID=A0A1K1RGH5_9PSEU|nr:FAD-dependent oxidoreductase [Amycolatopsis australiensis]SFW71049.1 2-polyprenyl-6-methoxyphenol hydroxylase [Amycolatopsis australiensis]